MRFLYGLVNRFFSTFRRKNFRVLLAYSEMVIAAVLLSSSTASTRQPVPGWATEIGNLEQTDKFIDDSRLIPVPTPAIIVIPIPEITSLPTLRPTPEVTAVLQPTPDVTPISSPPVQKAADATIRYPVNSVRTSKPVVFLTFDDGYDGNSITKVLDILREKKIRCTFFIVGDALRMHPSLWKQAVEDGHLICNHTASHKFLSELSENEIHSELDGWEKAVVAVLGEDYLSRMKREFPYMRLPGGMGDSSEKIMRILAEKRYIPIGWSVETVYAVLRLHNLSKEPAEPIGEQVATHVVASTTEGSIVLLHFNTFDVIKLESILQGIQEKGLEFRTMPDAFATP